MGLARDYIELFESNKYKQKFTNFCKASYTLSILKDPTDINQYTSLSHLFDAIDPFMVRGVSELERVMKKFVSMGQAEIPVKDRKFTIYTPKTIEASIIFHGFANWCTARPSNSNFSTYVEGNRKPNGVKSDLYIVINNKFFSGQSDEIYQIHFETGQIKDKFNQTENCDIYENVLACSPSVSDYFYNELIVMAREDKSGIDSNKYIDFLLQFGFCESLFDILDENTQIIKFSTRKIKKLPSLVKFKMLDSIVITNADLSDMGDDIGDMLGLELVSFAKNKLTSVPSSIGRLKNMTYLNLSENNIKKLPDEVKFLDTSMGGSLFRLSIDKDTLEPGEYERIKKLLPNVVM